MYVPYNHNRLLHRILLGGTPFWILQGMWEFQLSLQQCKNLICALYIKTMIWWAQLTLLQPPFSKVDFLVEIKWIFDVTLGKLHVDKGMSSETFACLMHFTGKRKGLGRMGCSVWISAALLVLLLESNQSYLSLVETWINSTAGMACDGW